LQDQKGQNGLLRMLTTIIKRMALIYVSLVIILYFLQQQNLNQERFDLVIKHLTQRGTKSDLLVIKQMQEFSK
jgi:hypothetical protein